MNSVVDLQDISKHYHAADDAPLVKALDGVSLNIPEGQYLAIMGPSGSGKSTLMNILGCLDRPTSGRFFLGGRDVAQLDDEQLSRTRGKHLGFVFQAFNLIPQLTVAANVEVPLFYQGVPRRRRRELAMASIDRVGLADRAGHTPSQLSGGQQQRVAIARALVNEPSLLLADEPTGNLDTATGESILALFGELHGPGLMIVMVTHDEAVADRCQRVVRLLDGRIDRDEMHAGAGAARQASTQ